MQGHIHHISHPFHSSCDDRDVRIMTVALNDPKDGFASEVQYVARLLQMAVSTERALLVMDEFQSAYRPIQCQPNSGWACLWKPIVNISCVKNSNNIENTLVAEIKQKETSSLSPLRRGILPYKHQQSSAPWLDTAWYGAMMEMPAPNGFSWRKSILDMRADIIPHLERIYGRFWIRAQIAHYLWKPNHRLHTNIAKLQTPILNNIKNIKNGSSHAVLIGFHIRFTDNVFDFQKHFARNASLTRTLNRYMQYANYIRQQHSKEKYHFQDIYIATDNPQIIQQAQQQPEQQGWNFILMTHQPGIIQRADTQERLWFAGGRSSAAAGIAADLEVLRKADFLVGSFQSNVYRLACELNAAWFVQKYPNTMLRHWTVDVEWYEDP